MNTVKKFLFTILGLALLFALGSCGGDDGGDDPQPTTIVFTTQSATLNGTAISPTPSYTLTVNFTAEGAPNGYSATGSGITPTPGASGTFAISGSEVTFTSSGTSRTVSITGGTITPTSGSVNLQWELTKVDDGVSAEEQGTYVFQMAAQ